MSAANQQRLLDADPEGARVEIETSGRVIRPALEPVTALVEECRVHASDDGLSVSMVDPANVAVINLDVEPRAFDEYRVVGDDEAAIGLPLEDATERLQHARMGESTDDDVRLELDAATALCEVTRTYGGTDVSRHDEWLNIDTDSIRQDADPPDLELSYSAELSPRALKAAVDAADSVTDHVRLTERDGSLAFDGVETDTKAIPTEATSVEVHAEPEYLEPDAGGDRDAETLVSTDYATDIADAIVDAKADDVTLTWGQEFPILMDFERRNDEEERLYGGRFMLAPRISSGGDD